MIMMAPNNADTDPMLRFTLDQGILSAGLRLGKLALKGHSALSTPSYIVPLSRGTVPHVTPDTVYKWTKIAATYVALEDCKS